MQRNNEHPDFLICVITSEIFKEPVVVSPSGHTFELEALERNIQYAKAEGKKPKCPKSRVEIVSYIRNTDMLKGVEAYLHIYPDAAADQYAPKNPDEHYCSSPVIVKETSAASQALSPPLQPNGISADDRIAIEAAQAELNASANAAQMRFIRQDQSRPQSIEEQRDNFLMQSLIQEIERTRENERLRVEEVHRQRLEASAKARRETQLRERLQKERENEQARESTREAEERKKIFTLYGDEENARKTLIQDIQDVIWALRFEEGPVPRGSIDNFALMALMFVEKMLQKPLPWQKIKVAEGPKNHAMYEILKLAKLALQHLDTEILNTAKENYKGQYDCVLTKLGGQRSLADGGYATFASMMGSVTNQPGDLVYQVLLRVDTMLEKLCHKHARQLRR